MNRKVALATLLISLLTARAQVKPEAKKDPHRPSCTSARCRKIQSFLKAHYCGESPFGNGPDEGCEIKRPKTPRASIKVLADFDCQWNEGTSKCQQHAQPSSEVRTLLVSELRKLGLPVTDEKQVYFTVWESASSNWSLSEAYYQQSTGADHLTICQIIAIVENDSLVRPLRKVPFQKTDADVPAVTIWSPVDLAEVEGTREVDVILEADAYEDHWLEVVGAGDGSFRTIFSGLGYYL